MAKRKILRRVGFQRGKSKISRDRKRGAMPPGVRRSKSGKTYMETRRNRSDKSSKKRL